MFPRKKKNRTGTISVVVVDKSRGGFREVKSFGVAKTDEEADRLYAKAAEWVRTYGGQQEIDFAQSSIIQQEFPRVGARPEQYLCCHSQRPSADSEPSLRQHRFQQDKRF